MMTMLTAADPCARAEQPIHLFILSGQSNMFALDPETDFRPEARSLLPGATVAHLKVAASGQPIRFWLTGWEHIARDAGVDQPNDKGPIYYEQILAAFKELENRHGTFASISFCWMQGERDAKTGLADAYEKALTQLIINLRRDLKRPDLNVVIGRLSDHRPGATMQGSWDAVRAIQVKVAASDPHGAWVDTDDLNDRTDNEGRHVDDLHYTREGYAELGRRLARQAVRLIAGKAPDASGRPTTTSTTN